MLSETSSITQSTFLQSNKVIWTDCTYICQGLNSFGLFYPASLLFIFGLFQTNSTFYGCQCEKVSIQYPVLGFEPMTY